SKKEWSTIAHSLLSPESDDFSLQIKFQNNSICLDLINFDEHRFNFQDNFESIINELKIWKKMDSTLEIVNSEVIYFRINHYLILFDAYTALFNQARKDTPGEYKNYNANAVRNRKWVRFHIKSILKLKTTKSKERKYNASWRIKFLVDNDITTIKKLVKAGASPRFFETITFAEFDLFLTKITDGKHKKLSIPVEIGAVEIGSHGDDKNFKALVLSYPKVDFTKLPDRIEARKDKIEDIIRNHDQSYYRQEVIKRINDLGFNNSRSINTQMDINDKIMAFITNFKLPQPGYYGSKGFQIISDKLELFITSGKIDNNTCTPQNTTDYLFMVLLPETDTRLIMEDFNCGFDKARKIIEESVAYGSLFNNEEEILIESEYNDSEDTEDDDVDE
ncbi:45571_t:CDS:2, partial [Gigaspora margarita]